MALLFLRILFFSRGELTHSIDLQKQPKDNFLSIFGAFEEQLYYVFFEELARSSFTLGGCCAELTGSPKLVRNIEKKKIVGHVGHGSSAIVLISCLSLHKKKKEKKCSHVVLGAVF